MTFTVPAATMGHAADLALELTQGAFRGAGAPFDELYELTIWPPKSKPDPRP